MDIRQILAPTDFSEFSKQAIESALALAQTFKAKLLLFHIRRETPELERSTCTACGKTPYILWKSTQWGRSSSVGNARRSLRRSCAKMCVVTSWITRRTPLRPSYPSHWRVNSISDDRPSSLDLNPIFALPPEQGRQITDARIRVEPAKGRVVSL
jgi:Universal stress protein family